MLPEPERSVPVASDPPPWEVAEKMALQQPASDIPLQKATTQDAPPSPVVEPQSAPPAPATPMGGQTEWPGWNVVCGQLKGVLSTGDYTFFSMPAMLTGHWDGEVVTIWAANQFVADLVEKPDISGAVSQVVGRYMGQRVPVKVRVGAPPAETVQTPPASQSPEEEDALDAFLAAGHSNVTVE